MSATIERFTPPTTGRFRFDAYCLLQLFSLRESTASEAVSWEVLPTTFFDLNRGLPPGSSIAVLIDSSSIFSQNPYVNWNTSLRPKSETVASRYDVSALRAELIQLIEQFAVPVVGTTTPKIRDAVLATPYAGLLDELRATSPWKSWNKLAPLLGTSDTQLARISSGIVTIPKTELARNIDELHSFSLRLQRLSKNNKTTMQRLLVAPRPRDRRCATELLEAQDYRAAFSAIMDAASPRPKLASSEIVPLRWYDEPSRDLHDGEKNGFDG